MARTLLEASASETAPSGRVPLTGAAASAMAPSRQLAARSDKARSEMENAFHNVNGDGVVGARFTDTWRQDNRRIPARAFLSERMALSKASGGTRGQGGRGPRRRMRETIRETSLACVTPSS